MWKLNRSLPPRISIHALREEGDVKGIQFKVYRPLFLSTPSARRATAASLVACAGVDISIHALREEGDGFHAGAVALCKHFYPRPPRGGRLRVVQAGLQGVLISIHALREEGDVASYSGMIEHCPFLSTPSARRATRSSPTS